MRVLPRDIRMRWDKVKKWTQYSDKYKEISKHFVNDRKEENVKKTTNEETKQKPKKEEVDELEEELSNTQK